MIIITIDGRAGTGKSTIAQKLSIALSIPFHDTGAMYRAVTWAILREKIDLKNEAAVRELLQKINIQTQLEGGRKHYFVGGVDVTEEIRTEKVNAMVSEVAAMPPVREAMWRLQRQFGATQGGIFEGRDMGSVVFRDSATLKFFLTARPEVCATRRFNEIKSKQLADPEKLKFEQVQADLAKRDRVDSTRELAPLKKPDGAIEIDTSDLTPDQVVQEMLSAYEKWKEKNRKSKSPNWLKVRPMHFAYRLVLCVVWLIFKALYRFKIYGLEHFHPGAAIIAPNHTSYFDPPIVGISWPEEIHYLARDTLFKGLFGSLIRAINAHPIQRDSADTKVFKMILNLLAEDKKVVVFPEGRRSNGTLLPFKPGIALLLSRSKSAIIPTYIAGSKEAWPSGKKMPKLRGKICCIFGSPICWASFEGMEKERAQSAILTQLEKSILSLKDWYEGGAKGTPP